jgi:endonuclease V-like protein UPF0215 family
MALTAAQGIDSGAIAKNAPAGKIPDAIRSARLVAISIALDKAE